jgi:hypothetical protein|tara:strand:- start:3625 stop:4278 length:654 start_codon:yes stop_codon:yes gene_type:complete
MATFQVRIEDIIGATASLGSDDATANQQAIQDALQDTAVDIINKVSPDILIQYATKSSNVTSNPIASNIENSKIVLVERRESDDTTDLYVSCVYADASLQGKIQNPHSIFFATDESPRWTFNDNDVYVYPEPAGANPSRYYSMENPTIEHGDSSVAKFPNELEHALVLGASARLKQRQITFFNEDEDSEVVILHRSQYQELLVEYANALAPYMPSSK